ncbi:hypothetical protein IKG24_01645 [Candidatus Saccharibacteria bacterium]|nr:hypothetical protein [Candidatus Saccharibacteria bacterium]
MKNLFTPERTIKFFFVSLIGSIIVALIIWPLMDLLFAAISGNTFNYTVKEDVLMPIVFMTVFTIIEFACWNLFHKEK